MSESLASMMRRYDDLGRYRKRPRTANGLMTCVAKICNAASRERKPRPSVLKITPEEWRRWIRSCHPRDRDSIRYFLNCIELVPVYEDGENIVSLAVHRASRSRRAPRPQFLFSPPEAA